MSGPHEHETGVREPRLDAPPDGSRSEWVPSELASSELAREGAYLDLLYERLEAQRALQRERLADVRLAPRGGTPQSRTERDALARQLEKRLEELAIGDLPLCFGRLDLDDGSVLYVGRIGIAGDGEDQLLMDWRAPKAALFYRATSGSPEGVVRRRHFVTRGRRLVAIEDEIFDVDALPSEDVAQLRGDAALLAELSRSRSAHMRDIVATIQREQDAIIRAELPGALVVQGGPGTGKTAVGLHRAAYLLYSHRSRLARSGVLIMGPSPTFLRYIEQVLPALGETSAVLATVRSFFPPVRATRSDDPAVAWLKSRLEMVGLISKAIRDRERAPRGTTELVFERQRVVLDRSVLLRARERGRRSRRPHNEARGIVEASILDASLAELRRERIASGLPEPGLEALANLRRGLREARPFRELMERIWPVLSPEQLLNDLFGSPALLLVGGDRRERRRGLRRK
jgi:DNA helicase IV